MCWLFIVKMPPPVRGRIGKIYLLHAVKPGTPFWDVGQWARIVLVGNHEPVVSLTIDSDMAPGIWVLRFGAKQPHNILKRILGVQLLDTMIAALRTIVDNFDDREHAS